MPTKPENLVLNRLLEYLSQHTEGLEIPHAKTKHHPKTYNSQEEKESAASATIFSAVRKINFKQKLAKDAFGTYIGLLDDLNTTQAILSTQMFGERQALIKKDSKWYAKNPLISPDDTRGYHRTGYAGQHNLPLLRALFLTFRIPIDDLSSKKDQKYRYFLASQSKLSPIEEILSSFNLSNGVTLTENDQKTAFVIKIDKTILDEEHINKFFSVLSSSGVTSSPWAIATYTQNFHTIIEKKHLLPLNRNIQNAYPQSKQALLNSWIISDLQTIDHNYPTYLLAQALLLLLQNAPDTLDIQAIQRIGLMLDNANIFYQHNYPRFAFCLYAIIHEITLALSKQNDPLSLENAFKDFLNEAKSTLENALDIKENLENTKFIAAPAFSGTNAYYIGMKLANQLQSSQTNPSVCLVPPTYYEFNMITQNTIPFAQETSPNADIYCITTGPIVTTEGLCSGVDINQFIKRHIIDTQRQKHTTLVVDATTTLYDNLHLNDDAKELLKSGQLSIILCESHQKFGLLHTDQAQYGRMFCLCSKMHFAEELLQQFQMNAQEDFNQHLDMRIGGFISSHCGELLETIKKQHMKYGNSLREMLGHCLNKTDVAINSIVPHQDQLENPEHNYFVTINSMDKFEFPLNFESRDSFGHFSSTLSGVGYTTRLCPSASDYIDSLLEGSRLCIYSMSREDLLDVLLSIQREKNISLEKQILTLSILEHLTKDIIFFTSGKFETRAALRLMSSIGLALTIPKSLDQCSDLRGREYYMNIQEHYVSHHPRLITPKDVNNPEKFLNTIKICYQKNFIFNSVNQFKDELFCDFVIFLHQKNRLDSNIKKASIFLDLLFNQKENEIEEFLSPQHCSNNARQNLLILIKKHFLHRIDCVKFNPNHPSLAIWKFALTQASSETLDHEAFIDLVLLTKADKKNNEFKLQEYKKKYNIQELEQTLESEDTDDDLNDLQGPT